MILIRNLFQAEVMDEQGRDISNMLRRYCMEDLELFDQEKLTLDQMENRHQVRIMRKHRRRAEAERKWREHQSRGRYQLDAWRYGGPTASAGRPWTRSMANAMYGRDVTDCKRGRSGWKWG